MRFSTHGQYEWKNVAPVVKQAISNKDVISMLMWENLSRTGAASTRARDLSMETVKRRPLEVTGSDSGPGSDQPMCTCHCASHAIDHASYLENRRVRILSTNVDSRLPFYKWQTLKQHKAELAVTIKAR